MRPATYRPSRKTAKSFDSVQSVHARADLLGLSLFSFWFIREMVHTLIPFFGDFQI